MSLTEYRESPAEQLRTTDLLRLMPTTGKNALDIGAREGYFSLLMADRFESVVALDLTLPSVAHPKVRCIEANAAQMPFPDHAFDFIFCAEVLEHVPSAVLPEVTREIERVANDRILIGVPYKQDIRVGRTTCSSCGNTNPPWGHVNSFDERTLDNLFRGCRVDTVSFVGVNTAQTNALSATLMDFAGNPYGTYEQDEACIHCGQPLRPPPKRSPAQLVATKLAHWSRKATDPFAAPRGNWMHVVLRKGRGA